jgi:hypothetical protein
MESDIVSDQAYSTTNRGLDQRPSSRDRVARESALRLRRITSLTAITLLSVGLWAAIWAAASSLTAVWLR